MDNPNQAPTLIHNTFLSTFKKWYDGHRGRWSDVEQAAQSNPQIRQKISQISSQSYSPNLMGKLGNDLEQMVKTVFPNHSYKNYGGDGSEIVSGDEDGNATAIQNPKVRQVPVNNDITKILFNKLKEFESRLAAIESKYRTN